jgi:MATE family multidrug resistance protein
MTTRTTFYLSQILGRKFYSSDGTVSGRVKDFLVDLSATDPSPGKPVRPKVIAVKVKTGMYERVLDFSSLEIIQERRALRFVGSEIEEISTAYLSNVIWLKQSILYRQVVDISGKKLEKVWDVRLVYIPAGTFAIAVDVGFSGWLRKHGLLDFVEKIPGWFGIHLDVKQILWDDIESVDISTSKLLLSKATSKLTTRILVRSVMVALGGGVLMILLQVPIANLAFMLIGGSAEVEQLARQYFYIRIYASPATLIMYAITGWFIGMQNARTPMILSISINVLNILFSLGFIYLLSMKSDGIALANVLSQCTGILLSILFLRGYLRKLKKYYSFREAMNWKAIKPFISVNKDIFIRTLCLIFVLSFFTTESAGSGDTILAVNTLLFQFFYFFSYFIDGYGYAAEALTGRYIGARDRNQLRRVIRLLFYWGFALSGVFTLIYGFGGEYILRFLTDNPTIILESQRYLFWIFLIPFVTFSAFLWDGIYVGATASVPMRNSMLIITLVIFLPAYYLLREPLGNDGLWLAVMIWLGARGISLWLLSKKAIFSISELRS